MNGGGVALWRWCGEECYVPPVSFPLAIAVSVSFAVTVHSIERWRWKRAGSGDGNSSGGGLLQRTRLWEEASDTGGRSRLRASTNWLMNERNGTDSSVATSAALRAARLR